jgi:hypothetical protein
MNPAIEAAINDLEQSKERLIQVLSKVPDDRLSWSPSSTARNPLQLTAHCAHAIEFIRQMMLGTPYPAADTAVADAEFLKRESEVTSRAEVLALLESNCHDCVASMQGLTDEDLGRMIQLPFGLGMAPVGVAITFPAMHTRSHTYQLEYVQTCYGDRTW